MIKKSSSGFGHKLNSNRRSASLAKINVEEPTASFSQLALLTEELLTLKKEKEVLMEYNQQLLRSINDCAADNQKYVSNHDKLHDEVRKINKKTKNHEQDKMKNIKLCRETMESIENLEIEIDELREKEDRLRKCFEKETGNTKKLHEVVMKMRNELKLQEKDRDRFRQELNCSQKQVLQLEEKVQTLKQSLVRFRTTIQRS